MLESKVATQLVRQALEDGVKFRTFHVLDHVLVENLDGKVTDETVEVGQVSVAVKKLDDHNFMAGFAFCSPRDTFWKRGGHVIALGRMNKPSKRVSFTLPSKGTSVKDTLKQLAFENGSSISWMNQAKELV